MNTGPHWGAQSVEQLVRYESLFKLLDDIQSSECLETIAQHVSRQWKYFSNATAWRLNLATETGFLVIDGFRGESHLLQVERLGAWDNAFWQQELPRLLTTAEIPSHPKPPDHLVSRAVTEIQVLPFVRAGRQVALLLISARHRPFSDLDTRFIHLFGGYLVDRIAGIVLRKAAIETLTRQATYDSLTGLFNRGVVIDRLESQLAHCARIKQSVSVVLADVDYFKNINDTHGHLGGDQVLREIGRRFKAQVREGEVVGRYGGEEFLFVLYPCDLEEARCAAQRFLTSIADTPIQVSDEATQSIIVTLSLGVSSTRHSEHVSMHQLLKWADEALYRAKREGRNRVIVNGDEGVSAR